MCCAKRHPAASAALHGCASSLTALIVAVRMVACWVRRRREQRSSDRVVSAAQTPYDPINSISYVGRTLYGGSLSTAVNNDTKPVVRTVVSVVFCCETAEIATVGNCRCDLSVPHCFLNTAHAA